MRHCAEIAPRPALLPSVNLTLRRIVVSSAAQTSDPTRFDANQATDLSQRIDAGRSSHPWSLSVQQPGKICEHPMPKLLRVFRSVSSGLEIEP